MKITRINPTDTRKLLAPVVPTTIWCIGLNYRQHAAETHAKIPEYPILFAKGLNAVQNPGDPIEIPTHLRSDEVDYEGELAVVISRDTRRVTPEEAKKAVLGWTCANDVTERDLQGTDKQWWRAKGYDTFAVAGPYIETDFPGPEAWIRTRVNGELRQEGQVRDMIRDPFEVISLVSEAMTLQRGDLIMLGTPPGVGELHPGDEVEVEIDGVGYLRNLVRAEDV